MSICLSPRWVSSPLENCCLEPVTEIPPGSDDNSFGRAGHVRKIYCPELVTEIPTLTRVAGFRR